MGSFFKLAFTTLFLPMLSHAHDCSTLNQMAGAWLLDQDLKQNLVIYAVKQLDRKWVETGNLIFYYCRADQFLKNRICLYTNPSQVLSCQGKGQCFLTPGIYVYPRSKYMFYMTNSTSGFKWFKLP